MEDEGKQAELREQPRRAWCAQQISLAQTAVADLQDEASQSSADVAEVRRGLGMT